METNATATAATEKSNVVEISRTKNLVEMAASNAVSLQEILQEIENRFQRIENVLKNVEENHELFMQGLEDAARECLKSDLIRVTLPQVFREKLSGYIAAREKARENAVQAQK